MKRHLPWWSFYENQIAYCDQNKMAAILQMGFLIKLSYVKIVEFWI